MKLSETGENGSVRVKGLFVNGNMRRRLQDLGIVTGSDVVCVGTSPLGDPRAYLIKGAVIAIRNREADLIEVEKIEYGQ